MKSNIVGINSSQNYFEVSNTEMVVDILNKLEINFKKGEKHIAFSSTNYQSLQHKCIFLGTQYYNQYYPNIKVAIVTFHWDKGLVEPFYRESEPVNSFTRKFHHHFYLLDWAALFREKDVKEKFDEYDVVLWDLPDFDFLKKNYEHLKNQIEFVNVLYIISLKASNFSDEDFLNSIQKYYSDHGLDVNQILPWKNLDENHSRKRTNIFKKIISIFKT
ncbi:MAG: hypothetical protein ACXVLQ_15520 [Bacteriovorax sp.]